MKGAPNNQSLSQVETNDCDSNCAKQLSSLWSGHLRRQTQESQRLSDQIIHVQGPLAKALTMSVEARNSDAA